METTTLEEKIHFLPMEIQQEIEKLVDSFLKAQPAEQKGTLKLDWRGALKDLREKYTSVELQHEAQHLWMKNVSSR
ncbi:MAG: DUF2281 domain-containing protein [Ignavibacteriales bacterium]|nr:DUF2281 domain-containing protein [Ignavibacteriales bacterium]